MRFVPNPVLVSLVVALGVGLAGCSAKENSPDYNDGNPVAGSGGTVASGSGGRASSGSGGMASSPSGGKGGSGAGGGGNGGADAKDAGNLDAGVVDASSDAASIVDADVPPTMSEGLVGWATVEGDGVTTTTGGSGGSEVTVTTAAALIDAAGSDGKKIIRIEGTIAVPALKITSDKTLIGVDADATIEGGLAISGSSDTPVRNVIIQNLRVNGRTSGDDADNDAICVRRAHHVWVDHCEVFDGGDGNLDIVNGSSWVTVSWTRFHYTSQAPDQGHRFSNLLGNSENNADEDTGRIKVTLHHNWWDKGVIERMPRVRFGEVHVFDNYYSATGNNYAVAAGQNAQIRIENNVFDDVNDPHKFYDGESGGKIAQMGNIYLGASMGGKRDEGGGSVFTPPYDYELDPAADVASIVKAGAGPK